MAENALAETTSEAYTQFKLHVNNNVGHEIVGNNN